MNVIFYFGYSDNYIRPECDGWTYEARNGYFRCFSWTVHAEENINNDISFAVKLNAVMFIEIKFPLEQPWIQHSWRDQLIKVNQICY